METEVIRYYWSFRSPYAWLASHRIDQALAGLPVRLQSIPVYPPPDMPNNPTLIPTKVRYIWEDVARFAQRDGLTLRRPAAAALDPDWKVSHTAYLYARSEGRGQEFYREGFAARFERGEDLGDPRVLSALAKRCGIDPARVCAAHQDPKFGGELLEGFSAALKDQVFGVPTFVFRGEMFWGNDRIEWLVEAIERELGTSS